MILRIFIIAISIIISPVLLADSTQGKTVKNVPFDADYYPSQSTNETKKYGIIVLNGSSGGKSDFMAKKINDMGNPVLSLAYFDRKSDGTLPTSLENIPLEYVTKAKFWLMKQQNTRNDGVIVYGLSKGAELALVLASYDADYKGVIATAPSAVVWSGIPKGVKDDYSKASSSWSLNGKPLHFVPYLNRTEFRTDKPTPMLDWHQASLNRYKHIKKALINVGNIQAPILLFSGGQDSAWPSNNMAKLICELANVSNSQIGCTHINYPNAPHLLGDKGPVARIEMARFLEKLNH
jgi:dienelactone hydrolase